MPRSLGLTAYSRPPQPSKALQEPAPDGSPTAQVAALKSLRAASRTARLMTEVTSRTPSRGKGAGGIFSLTSKETSDSLHVDDTPVGRGNDASVADRVCAVPSQLFTVGSGRLDTAPTRRVACAGSLPALPHPEWSHSGQICPSLPLLMIIGCSATDVKVDRIGVGGRDNVDGATTMADTLSALWVAVTENDDDGTPRPRTVAAVLVFRCAQARWLRRSLAKRCGWGLTCCRA